VKPILIYYDILNYLPENIRLLESYFQLIQIPDPSCDKAEILQKADAIIVPLGYFFGKKKIDTSSYLKVIGSNTTGHPHIDVQYAHKMGIKVVTLKGHHEILDRITSTAELAWGLIIAVTRNICPAYRSVLNGHWERWPFGGRMMLSNMSLGVVGYGRLGKKVAEYGVCFGMKVNYYDPYVKKTDASTEKKETLEELVSVSDVVSVHVPHELTTENLFNENVFGCFKERSYFVNTSRGEIVDHNALLDALRRGKLSGAALDVLEDEFNPGFQKHLNTNHLVQYALNHDNLIITPHIGGSTIDAWRMTQEFTIKKMIEAL